LFAEGLTNREIVGTANYRACIKLDVTDRDELAKIVWRNAKR
jgi:hypothetical protein